MQTLEQNQTDFSTFTWEALTRTIRYHPDPATRRRATTEAYNRVWNGPGQPEEMCPARLFLADW